MHDPMLTLRDISVTLGETPVLRGLEMVLGATGITAMMGPNGAGKSATLRVIAGLLLPDSGAVAGRKPHATPREVALVFQKPVLLRRSARANLAHALATYGVPKHQRDAEVNTLLHKAGLTAQADRPARALSGGEQQRLALVRALAAQPNLLLLDEPTASLDPSATAMIEDLVRDAAARDIRVLLVTHDQGQARRLADDIIFLHEGRVVETAPAPAFFDTPTSPEARAYLAGDLLI
ncbi:MAG: ATP-binding cassette domain-containing protein [Pseudomonadota bacterium]